MGTSSERFCLRWNDFLPNVSGYFRELRQTSHLCDVTLLTSDCHSQTYLKAHRVVLSASSDFFKTLFLNHGPVMQSPTILLHGIDFVQLNHVVDFIYNGEVHVLEEDIDAFLTLAEELQIKGLTRKEQNRTDSVLAKDQAEGIQPSTAVADQNSYDTEAPIKRQRKSNQGMIKQEGPFSTFQPILHADIKVEEDADSYDNQGSLVGNNAVSSAADQSEGLALPQTGMENLDDAEVDDWEGEEVEKNNDMDYDEEGLLKDDELGVAQLSDGQVKCLVCSKMLCSVSVAKRHYKEQHKTGEKQRCRLCSGVYKNQRSLDVHMVAKHGISKRMLKNRIVPQ